jgi:hypothetical protein
MIGGPVGGASPATLMSGRQWLLVPIGVAVVVCLLGYRSFTRMAPRMAEEL